MLGRVRSSAMVVAVALVAVMALPACVGSPVQVAETKAQKGYALYGSFVIAEERVEVVTRDGSPLSDQQKLAAIDATQAAAPVFEEGLQVLGEYQATRAEFEAGAANEGRLEAFSARLDGWVTEADRVLARVLASLRGVPR